MNSSRVARRGGKAQGSRLRCAHALPRALQQPDAHCTHYAHSVKWVSTRQRSSKANHQFPVPTRRCQKRFSKHFLTEKMSIFKRKSWQQKFLWFLDISLIAIIFQLIELQIGSDDLFFSRAEAEIDLRSIFSKKNVNWKKKNRQEKVSRFWKFCWFHWFF